jgi:hypothetical protein
MSFVSICSNGAAYRRQPYSATSDASRDFCALALPMGPYGLIASPPQTSSISFSIMRVDMALAADSRV